MSYRACDTTVVLLAAGHGKRMRELTETTPKPLLKVGELSLIEHHLVRLAQQGFQNIVINLAYLADQIQDRLGDGSHYGLKILYSDESATGALETAGGIRHALHLIDSDPFIVINADIWTDYPFADLLKDFCGTARLVMVENPAHNQAGDFSVAADSSRLQIVSDSNQTHTFSGIAIYHKASFEKLAPGPRPLAPVLRKLIAQQDLDGEVFEGLWQDIGTPERLAEINRAYLA